MKRSAERRAGKTAGAKNSEVVAQRKAQTWAEAVKISLEKQKEKELAAEGVKMKGLVLNKTKRGAQESEKDLELAENGMTPTS